MVLLGHFEVLKQRENLDFSEHIEETVSHVLLDHDTDAQVGLVSKINN